MLKGINWLAVLIAVVLVEVLGFLWYGPLFGTAWTAAYKASLGHDPVAGNMTVTMSLGVVNSLILVVGLAWALARMGGRAVQAIVLSALIWFFFNFTTMAVEYLYMSLSAALVGINMGFQLVTYLVAGAVLGFMPAAKS